VEENAPWIVEGRGIPRRLGIEMQHRRTSRGEKSHARYDIPENYNQSIYPNPTTTLSLRYTHRETLTQTQTRSDANSQSFTLRYLDKDMLRSLLIVCMHVMDNVLL
jgi:hypothetical protein